MDDIADYFPLMIIVLVLGTSFWVFIDANKIGVKAGQLSGLKGMGPAGWLFSCLLLWIIAFPYYLAVRERLKFAQPRCLECGGVVNEGARKCVHCGSIVERMFDVCCPACGEKGQLRESRMSDEIECPACKRVFPAAAAKI
jgi:hypothetical protein